MPKAKNSECPKCGEQATNYCESCEKMFCDDHVVLCEDCDLCVDCAKEINA